MAKLKKNNNQIFSLNKIKQLSLENFKGFEKKTNLEFSPGINLIYGRNSAGKSTIIQSLRLLKQSLYIKSSPCNFHLVVPSFMRIPGSLAFPEGFSGLINKKDLSKDLISVE
jgi:energy-coupling factor transporter ATP-binding protein EcfA2